MGTLGCFPSREMLGALGEENVKGRLALTADTHSCLALDRI